MHPSPWSSPAPTTRQGHDAAGPRARQPALAALMSMLLPGLGQLYNGEANKAIWLFLVFAVLAVPGMALVALYLPQGLAGLMAKLQRKPPAEAEEGADV